MSWLPDRWRRKPDAQPESPPPTAPPVLPTPGPVKLINYWRALQLLKNTPFLELWQQTRKEIPGLLVGVAFVIFCLFSCVFTLYWFVSAAVSAVWRGLSTFVKWLLA